MPHITTRFDEKHDLVIHTVAGTVSADEILSVLEEYYRQHVTAYVVWDLRDADLRALTGEAFQAIISLVSQYAHLRPGGKTTIVGNRDVSFGVGRQFSLLGEAYEEPFAIQAFRSMDEAMQWLLPAT